MYVITGVIDDKDHPSDTGATTITADGQSIYITNIHNADGTIRHDAFTVKLKNGDTITVSAKIAKNGSGEVQLHETRLASHTDLNPADHTCDICGGVVESGSTESNEIIESLNIYGTTGTLAGDKSNIQWTSNGVTVINKKTSGSTAIVNSDSDLFRVYANSTFTISATNITKIVITCTSGSYATACKNSFTSVVGLTATVSGSVVTITLESPADSIMVTASAQFRLNKVEVTYTSGGNNGGNEGGETPCEHTNITTNTVEATCIAAGSVTVKCDACGVTVSTETIPATGEHTYENGACTGCGEEDPNAGGEGGETPVEPTILATFTLGANGSASHVDGSEKTTYTETVNGYTLNITEGSKMYTGARDAKGNSAIKLGTGSAAGKFLLTVPNDVTKVVIYVAKYKTNTSKVTINGTTYTLTNNSNNGEYDVIEIDTTTTKTITLTTVSGGYRAMVNTIEFWG